MALFHHLRTYRLYDGENSKTRGYWFIIGGVKTSLRSTHCIACDSVPSEPCPNQKQVHTRYAAVQFGTDGRT